MLDALTFLFVGRMVAMLILAGCPTHWPTLPSDGQSAKARKGTRRRSWLTIMNEALVSHRKGQSKESCDHSHWCQFTRLLPMLWPAIANAPNEITRQADHECIYQRDRQAAEKSNTVNALATLLSHFKELTKNMARMD